MNYYKLLTDKLISRMITATITSENFTLPKEFSEEVETHQEYSLFSYFLTTDYDFKQDLLSFGKEVEVLEPEGLRNNIIEIIKSLTYKYIN